MPSTAKKALTEAAVLKLNPPRTGRREIADALAPGLVLRVTERGVKSWSVIYKVPGEGGFSRNGRPLRGKQHRFTLGQYPIVGLVKARKEAREIMERVVEGVDPAPALRTEMETRFVNSVEAVSKRMIDFIKKDVASWEKVEQTLRQHVWPTLGSRPISDVTNAQIHALLDQIVSDGRVGTAREVRKHMSRLMNYSVQRGLIVASPMASMKRTDLAQKPRERTLTDEELRAFWAVTGEMAYPFGPLFRLLLLTGKRNFEWSEATSAWLDMKVPGLIIPAAQTKSRKTNPHAHLVPLVGEALSIATALPKWETKTGSYFLFSTTAGKKPVWLGSKMFDALNDAVLSKLRHWRGDAGLTLPRFTAHDLRRTCETHMARVGIVFDTREEVLGHKKKGLQRVYNHYDYLKEKREALLAYEAHLMELVR
ncbi:MAG: integrase arm-type DNA-binding domain-containing protein [Alphaproteobacteria bacterium]|nr:integrase arm-type DNA-binding domain-containing protein [Alphaproteobacteria bacterium]